ncbi:MAG: 3-oxoacyl-ACP reductase FabG [Clostridia bacterium]|nr:3-oxoacyl-ACP reductase FabG [Clostridia bacterium]
MKKKTALITGSSRGIGAQMARQFAEDGYNVIITYFQSKDKALALLDEITQKGGTAIAVYVDIRKEEDVQNLFEVATKTFGHIDVLINNAGIAFTKLIIDCQPADFDNLFATNLRGNFMLTKLVIPQMLSHEWGRIINISSIWGQTGGAMEAIYSATKGAIIAFSKALAKEYALSNITVNTIAPGVIDTDMIRSVHTDEEIDALRQYIPMEKIAQPEEIANMALFLASDKSSYITGQVLGINGGLYI